MYQDCTDIVQGGQRGSFIATHNCKRRGEALLLARLFDPAYVRVP